MILNSIYMQNFAISIGELQAQSKFEIYLRYIKFLEVKGISNPLIDKLPTRKALMARQTEGKYLVRAELAILYAHTKTLLVKCLLQGSLVDDPYCLLYLYHAFPKAIADQYGTTLSKHVLRREIIATQISDMCINDMGLLFIQQMKDETRCSEEMAVKAYFISLEIFQMRPALNFIYENLERMESTESLMLFDQVRKLLRSAACWLVHNLDLSTEGSMQSIADIFSVPVELLCAQVSTHLHEADQAQVLAVQELCVKYGADSSVAASIGLAPYSASLLNVVWALRETTGKIERFSALYFWLGDHWSLNWLRQAIDAFPVDSIWVQVAKATMLADLDKLQRDVSRSLFVMLKSHKPSDDFMAAIDAAASLYPDHYADWMHALEQMKTVQSIDFAVVTVALMRLGKLCDLLKHHHVAS